MALMIEDDLSQGEQVLFVTQVHWLCYLGDAVLPTLLLTGIGLVIHPGLGLLVLAGLVAFFALAYKRQQFAVTNKRVYFTNGIISTSTFELMLPKIESLNVEQGLFARMLGYGTINVVGSGGTRGQAVCLARVNDVRKAYLDAV